MSEQFRSLDLAMKEIERLREEIGRLRAALSRQRAEDPATWEARNQWHPMTAINKRARPFGALSLSEQEEIIGEYGDWSISDLRALRWEKVDSQPAQQTIF